MSGGAFFFIALFLYRRYMLFALLVQNLLPAKCIKCKKVQHKKRTGTAFLYAGILFLYAEIEIMSAEIRFMPEEINWK